MKLFGNRVSPKTQRELLMRLIFIVISGTIIVLFAFRTVAWFSYNSKNTLTGGSVRVDLGTFDVMVVRTTEYDRTRLNSASASVPIYQGVDKLKEYLAETANGGYLTEKNSSPFNKTTAEDPSIAIEFVNELEDLETTTRYMMPGAYGTIDFYIIPKTGEESTGTRYQFTLDTVGLQYIRVVENDVLLSETISEYVPDPLKVGDEEKKTALENVLNGHVLFFSGQTVGGKYEGLINETYTYTADPDDWGLISGEDYGYHVTLYWIWPRTYKSMIDGAGIKYPTDIGDFIAHNPEYFFNCDGTTYAGISNPDTLSEMYNECDQLIGDNFKFLVLYLKGVELPPLTP